MQLNIFCSTYARNFLYLGENPAVCKVGNVVEHMGNVDNVNGQMSYETALTEPDNCGDFQRGQHMKDSGTTEARPS